MSGPLARYAFINAKLRARISKLLPEEAVGALVRAPSLIEAVQLLKGTGYGAVEEVYTTTGDLKMAELALLERELELFVEVQKYLSGPPFAFVVALGARFEVENLKNVLRLWFDRAIRGRDIQARSGYLLRKHVLHRLDIDALLGAADVEGFAELLAGTPYGAIVAENGRGVAAEKSLFPVEVALDKHYYSQLLATADSLDRRDQAVARRLVGVEIDMANIGWIVRMKSFYDLPVERALRSIIPSGWSVDEKTARAAYASQNVKQVLDAVLRSSYAGLRSILSAEAIDSASRLALVERILAEIMLYEVRHVLGGYPFSIGIVLAYFVLKQAEIRRLVTILNAKYYDASEERIAGML
jgi:V/A-type H+/Na+-transporting ATPase subunit C